MSRYYTEVHYIGRSSGVRDIRCVQGISALAVPRSAVREVRDIRCG